MLDTKLMRRLWDVLRSAFPSVTFASKPSRRNCVFLYLLLNSLYKILQVCLDAIRADEC